MSEEVFDVVEGEDSAPLSLSELLDKHLPTEPLRWKIGGGVWEFHNVSSYMAGRKLDRESRAWAEQAMMIGKDGRLGSLLPDAQREAIPNDLTFEGAMFAFRIHRLVKSHEGAIGLPDALRILKADRLCASIERGMELCGSKDLVTSLNVEVQAEKKS